MLEGNIQEDVEPLKNLLKVTSGLAITVLFLYLSFQHTEYSRLLRGMAEFRTPYLVPSLSFFFLSFWIRAIRWRCIAKHATNMRAYDSFEIIMIGFMVNNVLPIRMGEFARAYMLGRKQNISKILSLATVALERLLDGYTLIIFLVLGLLFAGNVQQWLMRLTFGAAAFYSAVFAFMILLNRYTDWFARFGDRGTGIFGNRISRRLRDLISSFSRGLDLLRTKRDLAFVAFLSFLVWLSFAVSVFWMIRGSNLSLPFHSTFSILGILALGLTIPSSPGYVGTIQYFSILALGFWGIDKTTALGFSIIYHAITYFPVTLLGLCYMAKENLSLAKLKTDTL